MSDTRDANGGRGDFSPTTKPNFDEGIRYVYLSQLPPEKRKQLAHGMRQTDKGKHQLAAMTEARAMFIDFMAGASFRLPKNEYEQYMKDGEAVTEEQIKEVNTQ